MNWPKIDCAAPQNIKLAQMYPIENVGEALKATLIWFRDHNIGSLTSDHDTMKMSPLFFWQILFF